MKQHELTIVGERINPGFKSSNALFENEDIPGIQELARKQADAGASYLNINIGNRAVDDAQFMREVIRAIQAAVDIPLSFDFPRLDVQEICLTTYDPEKAKGHKPIINSVAESRIDMLDALKIQPARIMVMASERVEDGQMVANTLPVEVHAVASRMATMLRSKHGLANDDIIIDVSISTFAADNRGLTKMALGGIELIGCDPELDGIHVMGGLSNVGLMLPKKEYAGVKLQNAIERSFLMLAMPLGFDTALATPWQDHSPLPEDHPVLVAFKDLIELQGVDFLRGLRAFLRT
ncbi:MAG: dihydropteroate synthase [Proteobacteria bacterium]|nr:dihydropteroate synthase [Pseudomonadota bacterium]